MDQAERKTPIKRAKMPTKKNVEATKRKPPAAAAARRKSPPLSVTLVTGGTGFLGGHLVRQLVEAGAAAGRVRVLSTSVPAWLGELGVEAAEGSITSIERVEAALENVAEIYHLAGKVSRETGDAHEMYRLHVEGTRVLCQAAARRRGVKTIVLASSSGTIAVSEDSDQIATEESSPPVDILARWPYYASKLYQERTALENFSGEGRRLIIVNPSLLLGPGDDRLSSTKVVLDFLARKIITTPGGGLSFVDARDAANALRHAMKNGRHGERYLLGAVNWSFGKFFDRLERLTKVPAPRFTLPSKFALPGARVVNAFYRQWKLPSPIEPSELEMASYFWYFDSAKAIRELSFKPRDPAETLHDTVQYVRRNFLGSEAFATAQS